MTMNKVLATSVALAVMLGISPHGSSEASAAQVESAQTQAASSYTYKAYQQEALKYLNDVRVKSGLSPLVMNPYLTKAAENHTKYLSVNNETGHYETKGLSGFTGVYPKDRVAAVGGSSDLSRYSGEVIAYGTKGNSGFAPLLSGVYHRTSLLSRYANVAGIGTTGGVFSVLPSTDMATYQEDNSIVVYPYSGQTGVPVGFYGYENPNPLAKYNVKKSGYAISVDSASEISQVGSFQLVDSKGNKVPVFLELSSDAQIIYIFPKYELSYEETYTASVSFTNAEGAQSKKWSFTTQNKPTDLSIYASNEYRLAVNGKFTSSNLEIDEEGYSHQYAPLVYKNTVYVPAKYLFERLNLDVKYDSKTKKYSFNAKNHKIMWQDGSQYALVNNKNVKLTQKPMKFHGDLYLPASFVKATTGASVKLMTSRKTVYVDGKVYEPQSLITKASK